MCPGGTYNPVANGSASCLPCPPGYKCGYKTSTPAACSAGQYSTGGAETCATCPRGRYGSTAAMSNSSCTGSCKPGYACPWGSTTPDPVQCPRGTYSVGSQTVCTPCPAGKFGTEDTATSCPGVCSTPGQYCAPGSTSAAGAPCPPGTYSNGSTPLCNVCPSDTPYSMAGSTNVSACSACSAGCGGDGWGTYPCRDMQWTPWVDTNGVEGVHSCLLARSGATSWDSANSSCVALGGGSHLLSSRQVGMLLVYVCESM